MVNLTQATAEQVKPVLAAIADVHTDWVGWDQEHILGWRDFLSVLLEEIRPGVRHGTVAWVTTAAVDKAHYAEDKGWMNLADRLYKVADALYDLLTTLEGG